VRLVGSVKPQLLDGIIGEPRLCKDKESVKPLIKNFSKFNPI
jgi:hypothetical protein